MNQVTRTWTLLALLISVGGCTTQKEPIVQHAPALPDSNRQTLQASASDAPVDTTTLKGYDTQALADRVLDRDRIIAPDSLGSRSVRDELEELNSRLLSAKSDDLKLLKIYGDALTIECQNFADGCTGIRYFQRAGSSSSAVAKRLAQVFPEHKYKFALLALKLKSADWDPDLVALLIESQTAPNIELPSEARAANAGLIQTALQSYVHKEKSPEGSETLLRQLHIERMLSGSSQIDLKSPTGEAVLTLIARAGWFKQNGDQFHPALREFFKSLSQDPQGILKVESHLKTESRLQFSALGLKPIGQLDHLNLVFDAVFTRRISPGGAQTLFSALDISSDQFESHFRNYLRLRFLKSVDDGTAIFKQHIRARVTVENLFGHVLRESSAIARTWGQFRASVSPLSDFAMSAAISFSDGKIRQDRIRRILDSIDRAIQLSSVYPHELILFHVLSQKRFEINIGQVSQHFVSTGDLMRDFFAGELPPILTYSNLNAASNAYELVYAFDFSLRSGLLSAVNVNPDFFIADTIGRLSEKSAPKVRKSLGLISRRFDVNAEFQSLRLACEEFAPTPQLNLRKIYFGDLRESPYYGRLLGLSQTRIGESLTEANSGLFYLTEEYADAVERARADLGHIHRLGEAMLVAYVRTLRDAGVPTQIILSKTLRTRTRLAEIQKLRKTVFQTGEVWINQIGHCYAQAYERDVQIRFQLLEMEKQNLRQIHARIRALREGGIDSGRRQEIIESVQFSQLPDGYRGQDQISAEGYFATDVDLLLRFRKYMTQIAPHVHVHPGERLTLDQAIVREARREFLVYQANVDDFVASGIRLFLRKNDAYLDWKMAAPTQWGNHLSALISLSRLERELKNDSPTAFSANEILKTQEAYLRLVSYSAEERQTYNLMNLTRKLEPFDFRGLMLATSNSGVSGKVTRVFGLYDIPYRMMASPLLGDVWRAIEAGELTADLKSVKRANKDDVIANPADFLQIDDFYRGARNYYRARASVFRGISLLPFAPALDKHLDHVMRAFVEREQMAVEDFESVTLQRVSQNAKLNPNQRPRFDLDLANSYFDGLDVNLPTMQRERLRQLHQSTGNCLKPGQGPCPDFDLE